jgi:hypothetical protein
MAIDPDRFEDIGTGDSPFARGRGGTPAKPAKLSSSEALKASFDASELFRICVFLAPVKRNASSSGSIVQFQSPLSVWSS